MTLPSAIEFDWSTDRPIPLRQSPRRGSWRSRNANEHSADHGAARTSARLAPGAPTPIKPARIAARSGVAQPEPYDLICAQPIRHRSARYQTVTSAAIRADRSRRVSMIQLARSSLAWLVPLEQFSARDRAVGGLVRRADRQAHRVKCVLVTEGWIGSSVNSGRKLTPWLRSKTDPLFGHFGSFARVSAAVMALLPGGRCAAGWCRAPG
jgi:hypothetical protein